MEIYFDDLKKKVNLRLALMSSSDLVKRTNAAKMLYKIAKAMLGVDEKSFPDGWIPYWEDIELKSKQVLER